VVVNALVGWIMAVASAALIVVGGVVFLVPVIFASGPRRPPFPGNTKPVLAILGCAMVATGSGGGAVAAARVRPAGRHHPRGRPARPSWALRVRQPVADPERGPWTTGVAEIRRIEARPATTGRRPGWWPWA